MKHIISLAALLTITACGGGSDSPAPVNTEQAIAKPLENIVNTLPTPAKNLTTAVSVNGKPIGLVTGKDKHDIVAQVVTPIMDAPNKPEHAESYRALLSVAGLTVVLRGAEAGKSSVNGSTLYAPDMVATVRLTSSGLVILF